LLREKLKEAITASKKAQGLDDADLSVIKYTVLRDVAAAPAIVRYSREYHIDLIVMGTHGREGLSRKLMGSVSEEVVRLAPCTVFTVREQIAFKPLGEHLESITVPVDFSDHARAALHYAKALARSFGARLDVVHVIEEHLHPAFYNTGVFSIYDIEPDIERKVLDELKKLVNDVGGPSPETQFIVRYGHPVQEILDWLEAQKSDLLVIATHGLSGLDRAVLGSVTGRVVRQAPCPVITVKRTEPLLTVHSDYTETNEEISY
jgi:nucleotide-binding universal stress UspA family protein